MLLSIWTDIGNKINEIALEVKDFFLENSRNPFLWVVIVIFVLIMFEFVYKKLNKD